jgi:hypothetical protein
VLDVDMSPAVGRHARLTVRAQLPVPQLAGEGRIALIAESGDLVEQGRRPDVLVVREPLAHIGLEPVERVRFAPRRTPGSRSPDR